MNEWISVENGKPDSFTWVLIYTDDIVTMSFYENDDEGNEFWLVHNDVGDKEEWENVTYWMPLPQPPKD